jgi:hypothetical protein
MTQTVILTQPVRVSGSVLAAGTTQTLARDIAADLVQRGAATPVGVPAWETPVAVLPNNSLLPSKPWRFRGKLLVNGETTTGWTGQSGVSLSAVQKPDGGPTSYRTNKKSVLRIATSTNTFRSATATVSTGPVTKPRVDVWIYLEDPTTIVNLTFFFATSDAFSDYYNKNVTPLMFVGWQCLSINLSTAGVTGSPTYETITRFRIQIQSTSTDGTSILFDSALISASAQSKCALIWDDGQLNDYTHTFPLLNKYNLLGNFALYNISARLEQWRMMADSGHRMVVHGTQNLSTFGTLQEAKNSIAADAAWVKALSGDGCDPDVYVWPNGVYMYTAGNMELPNFLEQNGFVGGFATENSPIVPEIGINPYILHRLEINSATVASTFLTALDAHLDIGLCFALCAHVTVSAGASGDQVNQAVLDDILSGIRTRITAGSLECVSARDLILYLRGIK